MTQYFDTFRILYAKDRAFPVSEGTRYQRKKIPLACVRASDLAELGRVVSVRTQNGTMDIDTRQNICYTLERNGELHRGRESGSTGSWNCPTLRCPRTTAGI